MGWDWNMCDYDYYYYYLKRKKKDLNIWTERERKRSFGNPHPFVLLIQCIKSYVRRRSFGWGSIHTFMVCTTCVYVCMYVYCSRRSRSRLMWSVEKSSSDFDSFIKFFFPTSFFSIFACLVKEFKNVKDSLLPPVPVFLFLFHMFLDDNNNGGWW